MLTSGGTYKIFDKSGRLISKYVNCTTDFAKKLIKKCKNEGLTMQEELPPQRLVE